MYETPQTQFRWTLTCGPEMREHERRFAVDDFIKTRALIAIERICQETLRAHPMPNEWDAYVYGIAFRVHSQEDFESEIQKAYKAGYDAGRKMDMMNHRFSEETCRQPIRANPTPA